MVLVSKFKQLLESAYNYKEALERENVKQENVKTLREKVKLSEYVPKFIVDKQVNDVTNLPDLDKVKINIIAYPLIASSFSSRMWKRCW